MNVIVCLQSGELYTSAVSPLDGVNVMVENSLFCPKLAANKVNAEIVHPLETDNGGVYL